MSQPVLDDEFSNQESASPALTKNIQLRVIIYCSIMLLGGMLFSAFHLPIFGPFIYLSLSSMVFLLHACVLSLVLESIRYFFRKRKERRTGIHTPRDPFWFEVVEGGFSIWILIMLLMLLNIYIR